MGTLVMGQSLLLNPTGTDRVDILGGGQWGRAPIPSGFPWHPALQPLFGGVGGECAWGQDPSQE